MLPKPTMKQPPYCDENGKRVIAEKNARIAELEAALAEIHGTSRRVTHLHEWYLDGVRQPPGEYVIMRVGNATGAAETPF